MVCEDKWGPREGRARSEVVSSGFILKCADWDPSSSAPVGTRVTYIAQLSPVALRILLPKGMEAGSASVAIQNYSRISIGMVLGLKKHLADN